MVHLEGVTKVYGHGGNQVHALAGVTLRVAAGEFVSVVGPSGSGKSTMLNIIGGLDTATSGEVVIGGQRLSGMSDDEVTLFRRRKIGFVFQFFNLLPTLTAEENVALPLLLDGHRPRDVRDRVQRTVELVGLADRRRHKADELSGGEIQRVAIARALVTDPALLLADEPTGNLDTRSGERVLELIREASGRLGQTILLVTHDARVAACADRRITIMDGRVTEDVRTRPAAEPLVVRAPAASPTA